MVYDIHNINISTDWREKRVLYMVVEFLSAGVYSVQQICVCVCVATQLNVCLIGTSREKYRYGNIDTKSRKTKTQPNHIDKRNWIEREREYRYQQHVQKKTLSIYIYML